jgi:hypothetical protein
MGALFQDKLADWLSVVTWDIKWSEESSFETRACRNNFFGKVRKVDFVRVPVILMCVCVCVCKDLRSRTWSGQFVRATRYYTIHTRSHCRISVIDVTACLHSFPQFKIAKVVSTACIQTSAGCLNYCIVASEWVHTVTSTVTCTQNSLIKPS